jgi:hypothetical protein
VVSKYGEQEVNVYAKKLHEKVNGHSPQGPKPFGASFCAKKLREKRFLVRDAEQVSARMAHV